MLSGHGIGKDVVADVRQGTTYCVWRSRLMGGDWMWAKWENEI